MFSSPWMRQHKYLLIFALASTAAFIFMLYAVVHILFLPMKSAINAIPQAPTKTYRLTCNGKVVTEQKAHSAYKQSKSGDYIIGSDSYRQNPGDLCNLTQVLPPSVDIQ